MASIKIVIHEWEKAQTIEAIKKFKDQTIAVSAIAKEAQLNQNRLRFIIEDLIAEGRVAKVATRSFNAKYTRYKYDVLEAKNGDSTKA